MYSQRPDVDFSAILLVQKQDLGLVAPMLQESFAVVHYLVSMFECPLA